LLSFETDQNTSIPNNEVLSYLDSNVDLLFDFDILDSTDIITEKNLLQYQYESDSNCYNEGVEKPPNESEKKSKRKLIDAKNAFISSSEKEDFQLVRQ
jgi:hypothetical protein